MNLQQTVLSQFKQPRGFLGRVAGKIMANRPSNIQRNSWLLELMQLKTTDRVLEIGFGPGLAIEGALQEVTQGMVVGIDHSEVMLKQASHRNATAINEGRASLMCANISELPEAITSYDHIYSANVVQFWDDPVKIFGKLRNMLAQDGSVASLFMPRHKGAISEDSYAFARKIEDWMQRAGFINISVEEKTFDSLVAVCVIGRLQ